jgi:lipoprotein-anchoring transpeptidase ErfK/SrfK
LAIVGLAIPVAAQTHPLTWPNRHRRIVLVSIADRKLAVLDGDEVIATFPVAVGATKSPSPTGVFQIVSRVPNPTYYRPGLVIPSGKNNPLGTRWVGLSEKGYGIHGTNAPGSVGHAASHGCIRLRNRDMEKLFTMVRVGDAVEILGDRDAELHMCSEATRTKQRSQRYELSKTAGNEGMRTFEQRCESTVEL